jgi:hypothetical protein
VKISCDGSDTFDSIWNRVLGNATLEFKKQAFGLNQQEATERSNLAAFLNKSNGGVSPSDVAKVLGMIKEWAIVVLDEFDKVKDQKAKSYMADLVKNISDAQLKPTLVLIGVGESIKDLIGEHPSISRNLVQVELKKLSDQEIREVIAKGFSKLNISASEDILDQVPLLANGFPHYAHLLGLSAAKACIKNNTHTLTPQLFQVACDFAIQDAIEKYRDAFSDGTATTQPSRYPKILCSCGYAEHDDRGVFKATDMVDALRRVFKEELTVQSVVPALSEFSSDNRGAILTKVPRGNRSHYRFTDPMMRPFLRIKAALLL